MQSIRGWRSFTSVPIGDVPVVIRIGDVRIEVLADRGGVVDTTIDVSLEPGWHSATLSTEGSIEVEAPILVVAPDAASPRPAWRCCSSASRARTQVRP